jgi:hypothetical protein
MKKKSLEQPSTRSPRFTAVVTTDWRQRVIVPVPFDPDALWGRKERHHVHGIVNQCGFRGVIERVGDGWGVPLGPTWRRDRGIEPGDKIDVVVKVWNILRGEGRGGVAPRRAS